MNARKDLEKQPETLQEIADRVAKKLKSENFLERQLYPRAVKTPVCHIPERTEEELIKLVTRATRTVPEADEEFLEAIPQMHNSWTAIGIINGNTHLQKIYALVMMSLYKGNIPYEVEKRIICLDNVDSFILTLTNTGQNWSHKAQSIMRSQHKDLHYRLFEAPPSYSTFMDK